MRRHVVLHKEVGETPLMAIERFKSGQPRYESISACYAGRLDPMASGKLLVLLGDECKKQERYHGLDKEYEIEVLFDVGSDTGDALGVVVESRKETKDTQGLDAVLKNEKGKHQRPYPVFSSKPVNGKPLFTYALSGTLDTITIPEHEEHIYDIQLLREVRLASDELQTRIHSFLARVPKTTEPSKKLGADFRINDVTSSWSLILEQTPRSWVCVTLRVTCGSGTYMRSLAGRIGEALGTKALALSIPRTKIGSRWGGL
jgi:tRNA pseudouridine55 synthase